MVSFVVDADRQLPNLYATAGVDRKPTVGAIDDETDVSDVTQTPPGTTNTGILPAPKDSEQVDLHNA